MYSRPFISQVGRHRDWTNGLAKTFGMREAKLGPDSRNPVILVHPLFTPFPSFFSTSQCYQDPNSTHNPKLSFIRLNSFLPQISLEKHSKIIK
jgi:hypothetical protein